jgi:signal transduction histidine kinase
MVAVVAGSAVDRKSAVSRIGTSPSGSRFARMRTTNDPNDRAPRFFADCPMETSPRTPADTSNEEPPTAAPRSLPERLAYLQIDDADRQRLSELAPQLNAQATAFVDTFYRHLFQFEETAQFLRDPELVARLKEKQRAHLQSMLEADWNEAFVERRFRVGDAHAQVGISPEIFLGAFNQYLQFCTRHLAADFDAPARECAEQVLSLQKAVFLDIGLTLEAYFSQATQSLRQALDLLYRANADLRQFAHLTSHDLKTPLATMANFCDEALDEFRGEMPDEAARLIEAARNRAFRMSQTIDELLSSTMSLHTEQALSEVSSQQAMAEAVDRIQPLLDQKAISLTVADGLPVVMGDPARLCEVFYNLLSNAIKFIDKRKGRIEVATMNRDDECIFSITDNGPGIPAEELERVFVPFRRLPNHRDIPGSGLGLYFTKAMVELQNGRVWVESHAGEGCRFYVLLKLASSHGQSATST